MVGIKCLLFFFKKKKKEKWKKNLYKNINTEFMKDEKLNLGEN